VVIEDELGGSEGNRLEENLLARAREPFGCQRKGAKVTVVERAVGTDVPNNEINKLQWEFEGWRGCGSSSSTSLHIERDGSRHRGGRG
jgi:hypothetical protein